MAHYITITSDKSKTTAFVLCLFFGWLGAHRYYVGKIFTGFLYTVTFGCFGAGWLLDFAKILLGCFRDNVIAPLRR